MAGTALRLPADPHTQAYRKDTSLLATSKQIEVDIPTFAESPYTGDEDLLRRMMLNLLNNAIEYTPPGGRVVAKLEHKEGTYLISISDTGIGIPAEAQPRIFDRFFRVDKRRARSGSADSAGAGAGLGLAIARSVAEAHRGTIKLARSESTGSTFIIVLPDDARGLNTHAAE